MKNCVTAGVIINIFTKRDTFFPKFSSIIYKGPHHLLARLFLVLIVIAEFSVVMERVAVSKVEALGVGSSVAAPLLGDAEVSAELWISEPYCAVPIEHWLCRHLGEKLPQLTRVPQGCVVVLPPYATLEELLYTVVRSRGLVILPCHGLTAGGAPRLTL